MNRKEEYNIIEVTEKEKAILQTALGFLTGLLENAQDGQDDFGLINFLKITGTENTVTIANISKLLHKMPMRD